MIKKLVRNEILNSYVRPISGGIRLSALSKLTIGRNIFNENWDVCIILDTCRPDALNSLTGEYEFLPDEILTVTSTGGSTLEWICNTFIKEHIDEISNTVYVSGNVWPDRILGGNWRPEDHLGASWAPTSWDVVTDLDLYEIRNVWKFSDSDYSTGDAPHVPSPQVTDHAIDIGRSLNPKKLIVHYLQPHSPYISNAIQEKRDLTDLERDPFHYLQQGGDREQVWEYYLDDLRMALDSVEVLLENLDAEDVVITADHGEAFGELLMHGHRSGSLNPAIRRVPWISTTAVDSSDYTPEIGSPDAQVDTEKQLEFLGYK